MRNSGFGTVYTTTRNQKPLHLAIDSISTTRFAPPPPLPVVYPFVAACCCIPLSPMPHKRSLLPRCFLQARRFCFSIHSHLPRLCGAGPGPEFTQLFPECCAALRKFRRQNDPCCFLNLPGSFLKLVSELHTCFAGIRLRSVMRSLAVHQRDAWKINK